MRNILCLFLFLPLMATAQREVLSDSAYIVSFGGQFYKILVTKYVDGGPEKIDPTLIGDSVSVQNLFAGRISSESAQLNASANVIINRPRVIRELLRLNTYVEALLGKARSPLLAVQSAQEWPFWTGGAGVTGWTLVDGNGTRNVTFDKNADGELRYRINSGTRQRFILLSQEVILRNYPSANIDTILDRLPNGSYSNLDGTVRLRKP